MWCASARQLRVRGVELSDHSAKCIDTLSLHTIYNCCTCRRISDNSEHNNIKEMQRAAESHGSSVRGPTRRGAWACAAQAPHVDV